MKKNLYSLNFPGYIRSDTRKSFRKGIQLNSILRFSSPQEMVGFADLLNYNGYGYSRDFEESNYFVSLRTLYQDVCISIFNNSSRNEQSNSNENYSYDLGLDIRFPNLFYKSRTIDGEIQFDINVPVYQLSLILNSEGLVLCGNNLLKITKNQISIIRNDIINYTIVDVSYNQFEKTCDCRSNINTFHSIKADYNFGDKFSFEQICGVITSHYNISVGSLQNVGINNLHTTYYNININTLKQVPITSSIVPNTNITYTKEFQDEAQERNTIFGNYKVHGKVAFSQTLDNINSSAIVVFSVTVNSYWHSGVWPFSYWVNCWADNIIIDANVGGTNGVDGIINLGQFNQQTLQVNYTDVTNYDSINPAMTVVRQHPDWLCCSLVVNTQELVTINNYTFKIKANWGSKAASIIIQS